MVHMWSENNFQKLVLDRTQVIRLGGKLSYVMNHVANFMDFFMAADQGRCKQEPWTANTNDCSFKNAKWTAAG